MGHMLRAEEWLKKNPMRSTRLSFVDPEHTYLDEETEVGAGTIIEPNVWIQGRTKIGQHCHIGFGSVIIDSVLKDNVTVNGGRVVKSRLMHRSSVGPFSMVEKSVIGYRASVGVHAQLRRTVIGPDSKVPHFSYVGDTRVGRRVNIGAGVITSNYNGLKKNITTIGDDAFIGTDADLIAPLRIEKGVMVAAGSVLSANTKTFPGCLVIARAKAHISKSVRVRRDKNGWRLERQPKK